MSLSEDPDLQPFLFGLFLSMYLVTVLGNLLIILAVTNDSHLHTPMYFFLCNLSFVDICFISTTVPKMTLNMRTHSEVITCVGCLTQMSLFILFLVMDDMLLTAMAYDRYVAICHPLHYPVIMKPCFCVFLILVSYFISFVGSQMHNLIILQCTYFNSIEISNFFCHPSQVLSISCSDAFTKNIVTYFVGAIFGFLPVSGIVFSYCKIFSSIMKISSSGGQYKVFSTCGSHLTVVCLFYGTGIWEYLGSAVAHSSSNGIMATLMYTVITPMLNPFIYSLRNRDFVSALKRVYRKTV
ncbi:olfactory receptor 7E24-like [Mesocricetus auratus]|uniref:Olfactory receptor 7E24-like n=1 Tax=Mesocricetus auratus TaxID=10036 RepID=A0ABM2WQT0_MESAU|nr:olfactory receptor 7E24-like [Mesocricetus auratus]